MNHDLVFSGTYGLTSAMPDMPLDAGQLVLSPTRTYAPVIIKVLQELQGHISGMVHCSGGAQTKILHFVNQLHIVKNNLFDTPPLFRIIQKESKTDWQEMYKVFNMGHRMEIYLDEKHAQTVMDIASSFNIDAKIIGHTEASPNTKLTIDAPTGQYTYTR